MGSSSASNIDSIELYYKQIYAYPFSEYTQRTHQELAEFVIEERKKSKRITQEHKKEIRIHLINNCLIRFPVVLRFTTHLSTPIDYQIAYSEFKTVLPIGNIGNGKSTVMNGLSGDKKYFKAAKSVETFTIGLHCIDVPEDGLRLLDT